MSPLACRDDVPGEGLGRGCRGVYPQGLGSLTAGDTLASPAGPARRTTPRSVTVAAAAAAGTADGPGGGVPA